MNIERELVEHHDSVNTLQQLNAKITSLYEPTTTLYVHTHLGPLLPLDDFLVDERKFHQMVAQLIKRHWQPFNLFIENELAQVNIDIEQFEWRIQQFLTVQNGLQRITQYILNNHRITYTQFLSIVFDRDLKLKTVNNELQEIIVFKIQERYFVQAILLDQYVYDELLFIKKACAIFTFVKLETIQYPLELMKRYQQFLIKFFSNNRTALIIHQHILNMDYENKKSFELKQIHLFNIIHHFISGKRSLKRLSKCIGYFKQQFASGVLAITEKEQTLFDYLLFMRAHLLHLKDEKLIYALALLEDERLNTYAVEMFFEFGETLQAKRPAPESLIKDYPSYYIEHIFYLIVQTLVENEMYEKCFYVLKEYDVASCSAIHYALNEEQTTEILAQIEATVQKDIAHLIGVPPQEMMAAIKCWQQNRFQKNNKVYTIATVTAKHVINLLKVFFMEEQLIMFEKLMEIYKKYLEIPVLSSQLHEFLLQKIDEKMPQI